MAYIEGGTGTPSGAYTLKIEYNITQSIANNQSTIEMYGYIKRNSSSYYPWNSTSTSVLTCGSETYSTSPSYDLRTDGYKLITSHTFTVTHESDEPKSINIGFSFNGKQSASYNPNMTLSSTITLPPIPRYATSNQNLSDKSETTIKIAWSSDSTIDYIWYSINGGSSFTAVGSVNSTSGNYTISGLSANTTYSIVTRVRRKDSQLTTDSGTLNVTTYQYPYVTSINTSELIIGNSQIVNLYNPMRRSVTIYMKQTNTSGTTLYSDTTSDTSLTFTPVANTLYSSIPNATSGNAIYYCAYSNQIVSTKSGTYKINTSNCIPSITSVSYEDTNATTLAVTQDSSKIIRNLSTVTFNATGLTVKNYATISSVKVTINSIEYNMAVSGTTATKNNITIDSANSLSATITLIDSRGLTATKNVTVTMLDWVLPTALITLNRKSNYYSESYLTVDATYSSIDRKNTIDIKYRYKKTSDSTWSSYISIQDNVQSIFNVDNEYSWDVQVVLTDLFGTQTYNLVLSRGMPLQYYDFLRNSVGFNCFPQYDNSIEINGKKIWEIVYPIGSTYVCMSNSTSPADLFGGTWTQQSFRVYLGTSGTATLIMRCYTRTA